MLHRLLACFVVDLRGDLDGQRVQGWNVVGWTLHATALFAGIFGMFCTGRPRPASLLSHANLLRLCLVQWTWYPSPTLRRSAPLCCVAKGSMSLLLHEFLEDCGSTCTAQGFPSKEFLLDRRKREETLSIERGARRRANVDGTALPLFRTSATSDSSRTRIDASMHALSHPPFQTYVRQTPHPSPPRSFLREYSRRGKEKTAVFRWSSNPSMA